MSAWNDKWRNLADRIDALSLRERVLIFLAVALALIVSVNLLLIDPLLTRQENLKLRIVQQETEIETMRAQIQTLATSANVDPDAELKARLVELQQQSVGVTKTLEEFKSGLVAPERIPALLQELLRSNPSIRLVSMKTLPVQTVDLPATLASAPASSANPSAAKDEPSVATGAVYRHGVEITVEGSYQDLVHYVDGFETLPWRMFWGSANVDGQNYPKIRLTLQLYTLSLDEAWLTL